MQSNFIYRFMQSSPLNGWWTIIPSVSAILFGITGLILGKLDIATGVLSITGGIGGLGLGSKGDKIISAIKEVSTVAEMVTPQAVTPDTSSVVAPTPSV